MTVASPRDPARRGGHVTLHHPRMQEVVDDAVGARRDPRLPRPRRPADRPVAAVDVVRRAGAGDRRVREVDGPSSRPDARQRVPRDRGAPAAGDCGCRVEAWPLPATTLSFAEVEARRSVRLAPAVRGACAPASPTGDFATGLAAGEPDRRARRGGEPPSRRRPALPARQRHAVQPRRRRRDLARRRPGPADQRARPPTSASRPTRRRLPWSRSRSTPADHEEIKPFWRAVLGTDRPPARPTGAARSRRARCRRCGSSRPSRTTSRGSGSTSTSGCRPRSPSSGSPRRSRPAGRWSPTSTHRGSGCSPTPRATRRASPPGGGAADPRPGGGTGVPDIWDGRHDCA